VLEACGDDFAHAGYLEGLVPVQQQVVVVQQMALGLTLGVLPEDPLDFVHVLLATDSPGADATRPS
jgi:hypothetical protein